MPTQGGYRLDDQELEVHAKQGIAASMVLRYLDAWADEERARIIGAMMKKLDSGEMLDDEEAKQAWYRLHAFYLFEADLKKKAKAGARESEQLHRRRG